MNNNEVIKNLQIKNGKLQIQIERLKLDKEEYYLDYLDLQKRIDKAIEYMRSQYTITDDDLYLALYSSDGTLDKLENILRGDE